MGTLYVNGTILTMEQDQTAEAVWEEGGVIRAVGERKLLEDQACGAQRMDLQGRTMIPAFIDAHSHFSAYANAMLQVSLEEDSSFDEMVESIGQFIERNQIPLGKWVLARGFDPDAVREKRYPDRRVLDRAAPHHPVLIQHKSGHMGVMNTMGLKICRITGETKSPEGGKIEIKDGQPTGYLEENAMMMYLRQVGMPTKEELLPIYDKAQAAYASHGITTVQEGMAPDDMVPLLQMLAQRNMLYLDLNVYAHISQSRRLLETFSHEIGVCRNHIKIGGYKIFLDGSPQGRTAWMRQPYENAAQMEGDEAYCGYPAMSDEAVREAVLTAARQRLQILAHCNGDAACDQYIRMCRSVKEEGYDLAGIRPVLIHGQLLGMDQLEAVKEIPLIPSFFAAHVYHWGDVHVKNFGWNRASHISPAASAEKKGILYTFHQDSPVIEPDMMETVWCAVNRKTKSGTVLGEEERIPVLEALKAVTLHAAYQYFEEGEKGSIRPGKRADFAILDRNPLAVEPDELRDIQVLQTIKDGRVIFTV